MAITWSDLFIFLIYLLRRGWGCGGGWTCDILIGNWLHIEVCEKEKVFKWASGDEYTPADTCTVSNWAPATGHCLLLISKGEISALICGMWPPFFPKNISLNWNPCPVEVEVSLPIKLLGEKGHQTVVNGDKYLFSVRARYPWTITSHFRF